MHPATCAALCALALSPIAHAARLVSGPMAGPPDHRAITIWLQADSSATAQIEYWPSKPGQSTPRKRSVAVPLVTGQQFVAHVALQGLAPGETYRYRVMLNGKASGAESEFRTQALWQWRTDPPNFTLLAGSCAFTNESAVDRPGKPYGDRHDIFNVMASHQPDLTLWLGDNIYLREVDWNRPDAMAERWAYERRQAPLQRLLRTGSHAATWDDHDYGPNDANRSYALKDAALALQQRYWANPSYGLQETPGAFTQFTMNDADIFLLDNRFYRDDPRLPNQAGAERQMFGPEQMRWLKNALLSSTARFKIIAGGSQMLNKGRGDSWADYPSERDDFLQFLAQTKVPGVLFMSGDVHRSELTRLERPGTYPLHDLTCSPLTSGVYVDETARERANLVPGTVVMGQRNFCKLRFEGSLSSRQIVIEVINADGQSQWQHTLTATELGSPWPQRGHPAPRAP
jgi:alkaline phosphatase D